MLIDLRSILHGVSEFQFLVDHSWWRKNGLDRSMIGLASALKVSVAVSISGNKYLLDGNVSGEVTLQCDRCLEKYDQKLDRGFHVGLMTRQSDYGRLEAELLQEDLSVELIDDLVIDLNEIAREQVFLALPMRNLCRADCPGLCPKCGKNLSQGACRCTVPTGHPGFSKLKQLNIKGD